MDVTKAINDIKAGKIEYRLDKTNIIHVPVGKACLLYTSTGQGAALNGFLTQQLDLGLELFDIGFELRHSFQRMTQSQGCLDGFVSIGGEKNADDEIADEQDNRRLSLIHIFIYKRVRLRTADGAASRKWRGQLLLCGPDILF